MSKLNPEKLTVEYEKNVFITQPIIPRRYTLTHSDQTAELYLTIGPAYAYNKITVMRDEVLGEWAPKKEAYIFIVYLHVDGKFGASAMLRNKIFRRELPLALEAIRYGDRAFFSAHPELDHAPIKVNFMSSFPALDKVEYWGTFSDYNITSTNKN